MIETTKIRKASTCLLFSDKQHFGRE